MAIKSGAYAQPMLLTLTAGTNAPVWNATGGAGLFIGLLTAGTDEASFENTTTAFDTYAGASWGITELVNGNGYTTAGIALPTPALSVVTGDIVKVTSASAVWTSSGAGFTLNPGGAFIYSNNATTKYMLMQLIFTGGPYTASAGGTFTVTPSASGLLTLTLK